MKKIIYPTLILTFLCCSEMEIKWIKRFEPAGPGNYRLNKISSFKKYSTYVTGKYWTADSGPYCITAKYNAKGELEWHNIYQHETMKETEGKSVKVTRTRDDIFEMCWSVYVHVQTTDRVNIKNSTLIKYDSLGSLVWERIIEKPVGESELESAMLTDYADNIYIAGLRTNSKDSINIFITKYNQLGEKIWSTKYYNHDLEFCHVKFSILKGDQILVGGVLETSEDFFFVRYDSLGKFLSLKKYENPEPESVLTDIKIDIEGNVYLTGTSHANETGYDYLTVVYDKNDSLLWARRFDGPAHLDDISGVLAFYIFNHSANVYVTGSSKNEDGSTSIVTVKYDKDGNEVWIKKFIGERSESAEPCIIHPGFVSHGIEPGFYIAGYVGSDALILKYNTYGSITWSTRYAGNGDKTTPTAFTGNCIAVESVSGKGTKAIIVKYGKAKQFGIARWD